MEYLKGLEVSSFDELKKQAEARSVAADGKLDEASLNWLTMEVTRGFVGSFWKEKTQSSGIKEVEEEEEEEKAVDPRRREEHCKKEEDEARVSKRQKEKSGGQCSRTEDEPEEEKVRREEHCKNRSLVDIGQQEEEARVSKRQKEKKKRIEQSFETLEDEKVADLRRRKKEHCMNESLVDNSQREDEEEDEARVSKRLIVKKKTSCVKIKNDDLQPAPDLPAEFAQRIKDLNGFNPVLVMQKLLTKTDVSTTHTRLTIPRTQIRNEFLLQEERSQMKNGMDVRLIEPCLAVRKMQLTKWEMNSSSIYVIRSNWMEVIGNAANGLVADKGKETARVQLWAFRAGSKRDLCFALVNLGTVSLGEGSGNGTTTSPSSSSDSGNGENLNKDTS